MDPYRTSAPQSPRPRPRGMGSELLVPFLLVWTVSAIRLISVLLAGRTFGVTDTLAAIVVVVLPWAMARGRVKLR